jgi:hypothetical protein
MKKTTVKKLLGGIVKVIIGVIVLAFLGMKSIDFFLFTTPDDQWYYAWLGFGLTGGGVIGYLLIFMWDADSALKKTIAIIMLAVCVLGELATAGFGLQVDAWQKAGYVLQESDFRSMVFVVQLLGFIHALALIGYTAGDQIGRAFADDDGDGIPNIIDRKDNRVKTQFTPKPYTPPMTQRAQETETVELVKPVEDEESRNRPNS